MKEFKDNLKKTWKYTKKVKKELFIYLFLHVLGIAIGIITPILGAKIVVALTSDNFYQIAIMGLVLFFTETTYNLVNFGERYSAQKIHRESFIDIQKDLGQEILKLENKSLDEHGSGVFIQRLTSDTTRLSEIFNLLGMHISQIVKNIGIFVAIFIINKICFVYLLFMAIVVYLIDKRRAKDRKENNKSVSKKEELATSFVTEMVRGARDIKMLNAEKSFAKELDARIIDANNERYKRGKIDRIWQLIAYDLRELFYLGLIFILIIILKDGKISAAMALVIYNYSGNTSYVTMNISSLLDSIVDFNVSATRVYAIIESKEFTKEKFGKKHIENIKGNFEFKNVSFAYKEDDKKVLDNLSFKIKSKETVAFVGKSGAGKTTIFNLLCKMYPNYKGSITIDGIDIKELDKDSIRGNITIISQNPYIFNVSIKDNLRLVKEDVTDEEIYEACKIACLDDFIDTLSDKYDTIVGEGGVTLSGGQKQRLAIARALVQKTEIILFDEATSALDNETQDKIQKAIESLKNYTILIIAHRLSTIINSDRILFLANGNIKASGTHKELLKKCKEYKQLYEAEIEK